MTIVNQNLPANLFVPAPMPSLPLSEDGLQPDVCSAQLVQATVVEKEGEHAILEINHQRYLAQGERELQVGQKLALQVIQTQPRLEFRVLNNFLTDKLGQLLPLLTRPFDWGQLLSKLEQRTELSSPVQTVDKIHQPLQQILDPVAGSSVDLKQTIAVVVSQLRQMTSSKQAVAEQLSSVESSLSAERRVQSSALLVANLQKQLLLLQQATGRLPKNWLADTWKQLASFDSDQDLPALSVPQRHLLSVVLNQMLQRPEVPSRLAAVVKRILIQIDQQVAQDVSQPSRTAAITIQEGSIVVTGQPEAAQTVSADIKKLFEQLQIGVMRKPELGPELLGRLEGLLGRLQQLSQSVGFSSTLLPGFEQLVSQLSQIVIQQPEVPQGGQLGLLSQLFGFHLEAELLQGKQKEALASLKLNLLELQKELGEKVKEPLQRLELFQLCKAKLAEDQVQFLPLPFSELEEGYLLAEREAYSEEDDAAGESLLQMSLSLRLSALGNIRIDMLYEKEGLHLRLACEDQKKMDYLKNCTDELKQSLQAIELQGISFGADARLPARQLQERLLPDSLNMLDARV